MEGFTGPLIRLGLPLNESSLWVLATLQQILVENLCHIGNYNVTCLILQTMLNV